MEYTARLDIASKNRRPRLRSARGNGRGRGVQIVSASRRASRGVMVNRSGEDVDGWMGSLMNSFTPSATGCRRPNGPTMLGPFRACI